MVLGYPTMNTKKTRSVSRASLLTRSTSIYEIFFLSSLGMPRLLMVGEKPSIADTLARALARPGTLTTRKGLSPVSPIHECQVDYYGRVVDCRITATCGHVYSIDFEPRYNNWQQVDPVELFSARTLRDEATRGQRMVQHLKTEAKGCDELILWLDCDREGENICFEVIDICLPSLSRTKLERSFYDKNSPLYQEICYENFKNVIWRAKFSSLAQKDLQRAFKSLGVPSQSESHAVDCRQEIDLKVGCAFTRFQTQFFQNKYGDLNSACISYGPCQSPTLWFCVERHDEIQQFHPEIFYFLQLKVLDGKEELETTWERGQIFDANASTALHQQIMEVLKDSEFVSEIISVTTKDERLVRPQALDTVQMLKLCSSQLGISPHQAMAKAERLYLSGYITYPRTETTEYAKNFDFNSPVESLARLPVFSEYCRDLLKKGNFRGRPGHDAGDHPPITPIRPASEDMDSDSFRVYELIARQFLASIGDDCQFLKTKVKLKVGNERFFLSGRRMKTPGFTRIQRTEMRDVEISNFHEGQKLPVLRSSVSVGSGKTRPPPYLSESDLLTMMQKNEIGTDASMATHIETIATRNYVDIGESRRLIPTKLGITLVHGFLAIDQELVRPQVRAEIERQCTQIAKGQKQITEVRELALKIFQAKFQYFRQTIERMDQLFEASFTHLAESGRVFGQCGLCSTYMRYIEKKPFRLVCQHCSMTYKLPQAKGTVIKIHKELKCPLDKFEILLVKQYDRAYTICPYCYTNPPFETRDVENANLRHVGKQGFACNDCNHPTCQHGLKRLGVCSCPQEDCVGLLCLDTFTPPKYSLDCNHCNLVVDLESLKIHRIKVSEIRCDTCSSSKLSVVFHKDAPRHGSSELEICLVCDSEFNKLVKSKYVGRTQGQAKQPHRKGKKRGR